MKKRRETKKKKEKSKKKKKKKKKKKIDLHENSTHRLTVPKFASLGIDTPTYGTGVCANTLSGVATASNANN
jgi:hypothetical protein